MSRIKLFMGLGFIAPLVSYTPVAAWSPAPPLPGMEGPGGVPHYFRPYGNWAFSPLPMGPIATVNVEDGGTGYSLTPTVTVTDAYITPIRQAQVTATMDANGVITGFTIMDPGTDYVAPVVMITDSTGTGAIADAVIGGPLTGLIAGRCPFIAGPGQQRPRYYLFHHLPCLT